MIVTTPQEIALLDARKGLKMFQKVEVGILGVVENMSTHVCTNCGHEEHIFGEGGGERMAAQYQVPFLGSLPLDLSIREQTDGGNPSVVAEPEGSDRAALPGDRPPRHGAAGTGGQGLCGCLPEDCHRRIICAGGATLFSLPLRETTTGT